MNMAVTVRSATLHDAESIAPLLGELDYPATPDEVVRRLSALSAERGVAVFVAEDEGRIHGVATVQRLHVLNSDAGFAQLLLLVVGADARRRGVGRALVAAAEAWALERGCVRMLVACGEERTDAHSFYEALGYHHTARRYVKRIASK
jgi:GNAT superfamily N-acetyltransferase